VVIDDLNEKQKQAVESGDGPLLIVAGAGSGKTRTLTARLAYLITHHKVRGSHILAITFTNKAADEMKKRVALLLRAHKSSVDDGPFVGTFHSFGARLLRTECRAFGRTPNFSIYDDDDRLRLLKKIIPQTIEGSKKRTAAALLGKSISRIKNEVLSRDGVSAQKDGDELWSAFMRYEKEMQQQNAFDFDDLVEKVTRLFLQNPTALKKYRDRYHYILVDEYQDVNTAQYLLVKLLAGEKGNITVVGDDQQSIYKFRFSDFRNFLNFEKDWPHARVVFLEQNYRSTHHIINAASALIAHNTFQKPKKLWTEKKEGSPVSVIEHGGEYEEASYISDVARAALADGKSVGILYRTNAQSRALEQVFVENQVSYALFGALSFYERKEVKDLLAALRLAHNPHDEMSFDRLQKIFFKRLSASLREELVLQGESPPAVVLAFVINKVDYMSRLQKEYNNYLDRIDNVQELLRFAATFSSIGEFLEKVSLTHPFDTGVRKGDGNSVGAHMMTIHLAKGLEFDVVLVAGVNEGLLPHQRSLFAADEIEEERRLMYVAMTRARGELILNFYGVPSRFLAELPGDNVFFRIDSSLDDDERYIEYS